MPDRTIMAGAQDGIIRPTDKLEQLWIRLRAWPVEQEELPLPANFLPSAQPRLLTVSNVRRAVTAQSEEGQRLWILQQRIESVGEVKTLAKRLNAERNNGRVTCEACAYSSQDSAMLDAHHPTPLSAGVRTTFASQLQILCPTCHRRAHRATDNKLEPATLTELRAWVVGGRP
jgi:5-methylcytosine-specific restriction enzyme A